MREDDLLLGTGFRFELSSLALVADQLAGAEPSVPRTARILHEYDHLVRLLGTSYGLIRHGLLSHYLQHFLRSFDRLESIEEFRTNWNNQRLGTPDRMTWSAFENVYFGASKGADLYRAQCSLGALGVLDGKKLNGMSLGALAGWAEYCNSAVGDISDSPKLRRRLNALWGGHLPPGTALIYLDGQPVTVPDILEYLGIVVEAAHQVQFGEAPAQFPDDLPPRTYLQILNVIKEYLPRALNPSKGLMAQELEALFELALWIPLWPDIHPEELPQHGVHLIPSYRLQAILDTCKSLDLSFSFGDEHAGVEEISPRAKYFHNEICDRLGWTRPEVIAGHWLDALVRMEGQAETGWNKLYFHHPRSQRLTWSKTLIMECASQPVSGAMLAGSRHYGNIGFPTLFDSSNRSRGYIANGEVAWPAEDRDFQRMDALLFTASTYATVRKDWDYLPQIVTDEAIETWRRTPHAK